MERVVDLTATASQGAEALDRTGSDGLLGSAYLQDDPPGVYLFDSESPKYLVRNKSAGLAVEGETSLEDAQPDGDHQALLLVTDIRVLVLVGDAGGDRVQTLPIADLRTARVERSGIRTQELTVETATGATLTFPTRGDATPVAEYLDRAATAWTDAIQTVQRAADATEAAAADVEAGAFDAARSAIDDLEDYLEPALRELRDLGPAAIAEALPEARRLVHRTRSLRRRSHAGSGARAHARAHRCWRDEDYVAAATAYGAALAAYARAREHDADTPTDEALARRMRGAAAERVVLRRAPLWDLLALKRRAAASEDPDGAAAAWDEALRRTRSLEDRDWPFPDAALTVDAAFRWDTVAECARAAVEARERAAERWAAAGDRLGDGEMTPTARAAYERAADHAERALALANESVPDRVSEVEELAATVTARLGDETVPATSAPPEGPLAADVLADLVGQAGADSDDPVPVAAAGEGPVASGPDGSETAADAATGEQDGPTLPPGFDLPPGLEDEFATAGAASATDAETTTGAEATPDGETDGDVAEPATAEPAASAPDQPSVRARIDALDDRALTDLVATRWETRGWSTMVLPETGATVYDILAAKGAPDADRLLIWTVHRPDGTIEEGFLDRIAEATDRDDAIRLVLVTTARVPPAVRDRAEATGVEILEADDLATSVIEAGLYDRLPGAD